MYIFFWNHSTVDVGQHDTTGIQEMASIVDPKRNSYNIMWCLFSAQTKQVTWSALMGFSIYWYSKIIMGNPKYNHRYIKFVPVGNDQSVCITLSTTIVNTKKHFLAWGCGKSKLRPKTSVLVFYTLSKSNKNSKLIRYSLIRPNDTCIHPIESIFLRYPIP